MEHSVVPLLPLIGAWLGLVGWLMSRFGTTQERMSAIFFGLVALYFILFILNEIWGTGNPFGPFLARNLIRFGLAVGGAITFAMLIFFIAGDDDNFRTRLVAEYASVGLAILGLAVDTFERLSAPLINWNEIWAKVCEQRMFH